MAGLETTEADVGGGPADFPRKKCQKHLEYDQLIFRIFPMDTGANEKLPATALTATII